MVKLASFQFMDITVRALPDPINPFVVAKDVCDALGFTNSRKAIADNVKPKNIMKAKVDTGYGIKEMTLINEAGLYSLILRSRLPKAEDFQDWVTSEVLPSIRKTGQYELPRETITVEEQYYIRKAVAYNAKRTGRNFRDVYNGLYNEFQIPRYKELKREDFQKALEFLDVKFPEKKQAPTSAVVLNESEAKLLLTFIYVARYLFRGCFALTYQFLEQSRSPMTGIFYEFLMDPHLAVVEKILDEHGYSVSDLECYKHYVAQGYNH